MFWNILHVHNCNFSVSRQNLLYFCLSLINSDSDYQKISAEVLKQTAYVKTCILFCICAPLVLSLHSEK